jgi:uncharacterized membrane protein
VYPVLRRHSFASWVFLLLLGVAVWHMVHYYPLLPDRVASHFGGGGRPDGWSDKDSFFLVLGGTLALTVLMFGALALVIPALPVRLVNVPHREHYLSPENQERTHGILVSFMLWFGVATMAFMILVADQTFRANLEPPHRLGDGFLIGLVAYLVFSVVATIVLIARFRKPPAGKVPGRGDLP